MRPNILTALALSLVLTLAAGHTALAQSSLQDNLGPLATAVDLGDDGTWATAQEGGWFTLRNANSDGAVRYYHKGFPDLADQNLRARVNLFTQSPDDAPSFAGLVFNYKSPEDFMAVAISDTGGAHYFVRGANGYDTDQIDNVTARLDGSDVLEVRIEGNTIYTELNGAPVFSVNVNGQITRELGIIAIGRGVSGFNNLAVDAVSQTPALPTPNPAPDNQGSDTLPPANPGQGDTQPPALPGGQPQPPALPGGGGADGPPPLPGGTGGGGTQPPALPGQNQPPALPGQSDGPPPIPGQNQPPALPGGQNQPPALPGQTDTAPGLPGQQSGRSPIPGLTDQEAQIRMGVALGIFLHELAHAVIGETRLPATGPEEDTADSFSAFTMSTMLDGAHSGNRDFVLGSIKASALLWYYSAKAFEAHNVNHDWQDEHAPDIKRFRNAFCIVFGSDPQAYDALADKVEFGDNARNRCTYDYERQLNAWEELLALRGRNLNDELPGAFPANQPGGKINLVFQTPQDQFGRDTEALLKHNDLVPILVQIMEQYFVWPRDVTITFRDCDEINAWYDPRDGSVTMCYSAIQFYSMFVQRGLSGQL